jgi:hypothetical protein
MTGFDQKVLHLRCASPHGARICVEVDFMGNGTWCRFDEVAVEGNGYRYVTFPPGFSAHWCRVTSDSDARLSAIFHYT